MLIWWSILLGGFCLALHYVGTYGTPLDAVDYFAEKESGGWYWSVWWFDSVNHAVGGLAVSTFLLWALSAVLSGFILSVGVIISMVTLGGLWEVYEYYFWDEHDAGPLLYPEDTGFDLTIEYAVAVTLLHVHAYFPLV